MLYVSESACPGPFRLVTQKQNKTKLNRALLPKYSNHFFTLQIKRTSTVPPRGCSVNTSWVLCYSKMFEKQIIDKNKTIKSKQANRTDLLGKMEAQLHLFKST